MPNWVEQDLHVLGSKEAIDRFVATGFIARTRGELDDVLHFRRLCPLRRSDRKGTYTHDSGVVLHRFRTRTQALFSMITSWDYPAEFYARLPQHWPSLNFVCSVNEDMNNFGGVIVGLGGASLDLVRSYDAAYDARAHARVIGEALEHWGTFLTDGHGWRVRSAETIGRRSVPFDARFDDDGFFYFGSRDQMEAFKKRYGGTRAGRLEGGAWKRVSAPRRRR